MHGRHIYSYHTTMHIMFDSVAKSIYRNVRSWYEIALQVGEYFRIFWWCLKELIGSPQCNCCKLWWHYLVKSNPIPILLNIPGFHFQVARATKIVTLHSNGNAILFTQVITVAYSIPTDTRWVGIWNVQHTLSDKISADKNAEYLACCQKFCPPKYFVG